MNKYTVELTEDNVTDVIQSCIHYREFLKTLVCGSISDITYMNYIRRVQEVINLMIETSQVEK